ncbi:MAG: bifunctional DNA-binding transcriptional regulator/O6-methylguanine-DNA methyltransferase Ada [Acidimicrobiales bacterium]
MSTSAPPTSTRNSTSGPQRRSTSHSAPPPDEADDARWRAVLERVRARDGEFVFAVRTTGVFCRPSCPARRPRRDNVRFFDTPASALDAGFRPCRRCDPQHSRGARPEWVDAACRILERDVAAPTLGALAEQVGVSSSHLQRTFAREVGVSPRAYAAATRARRLRGALGDGAPVTAALYDAGYGSASAAYATSTTYLGMTPGRFRDGGRGETILYTTVTSPLGDLVVAATSVGLVAVRFGEVDQLIAELGRELPHAELSRDDDLMAEPARAVLERIGTRVTQSDLPTDIAATAFQARVWAQLRAIPVGTTRTYGQLAADIGAPTSVRAVARACAQNPLAVVVPCHRVVRADGSLAGYRWGVQRKRDLLIAEGALDESTRRRVDAP